MDALMPEMDGYEATRKIRAGEARENNQNIIIIGFTANAMESNKNKSLALGMNDHITKPIDHKKLTKILDKWLIKIN